MRVGIVSVRAQVGDRNDTVIPAEKGDVKELLTTNRDWLFRIKESSK